MNESRPELDALGLLVEAIGRRDIGVEISSPSDVSFPGLAAMTSATRMFGCASLLREGIGSTVVAAATRGMLESAALAKWEEGPSWQKGATRGLLEYERNAIVDLIAQHDLSVPNIDRWLHPLQVPAAAGPVGAARSPSGARIVAKRSTLTGALLGMPSAFADLLAMAGHANATAGWLTVSHDSASVGFAASPVSSALLAHAVGNVGVHAVGMFGDEEIRELLELLMQACTAVTKVPIVDPPGPVTLATSDAAPPVPFAFLETNLMHDVLLDELLRHVEEFKTLMVQGPSPYESPSRIVNLESVLPYLTALDTASVCFLAAEAQVATDLAAVGARMLLEAGARARWTYGGADVEEVATRYALVRNEGTIERARLRKRLASQGVQSDVIDSLLSPLPAAHVPHHDIVRSLPDGAPESQPPPFEQMLGLGMGFAEGGWLALAYSLLSQVTHLTPLGLAHAASRDTRLGPGLSHEMTALALDVAVLGTVTAVLPHAHVIALGSERDIAQWDVTLRSSAARVHNAARLLHFLD
jgi:hypothetical protein